jgi:CBS-domain-containing membrane protein
MRRFYARHQPKTHPRAGLMAGLATLLLIGALAAGGDVAGTTLLIAPFSASCVLVFAAPQSPLSQPAHVVGGHVLAAVIGIAMQALPPGFWAPALTAGLAVGTMVMARLTHPPAGATALTAYVTAQSWWFVLVPVAAGASALVLAAMAYHRLHRTPYPMPAP